VSQRYPDVWITTGRELVGYCLNRFALTNWNLQQRGSYHEITFTATRESTVPLKLSSRGRYSALIKNCVSYNSKEIVGVSVGDSMATLSLNQAADYRVNVLTV